MDGTHAIDASGEVLLTDNTNGPYDGADELAQLLAGSPDVEACYALQWARFAVGSAENSELQCVQSELGAAFTEAEGRLDSLVLALVATRFFRERGGAPASEPETSGETGGESTSAGEATSDPPPAPTAARPAATNPPSEETSPGVDVMVVQDSKWDAGECNTVTVTNTTDAPITWQVVLELQGTIQNAWNAKYARWTPPSCHRRGLQRRGRRQGVGQLRLLPQLLTMHAPDHTLLLLARRLQRGRRRHLRHHRPRPPPTPPATTTTRPSDHHHSPAADLTTTGSTTTDHRPPPTPTPPAPATGCADLPLCDDFEAAAAGGPPDPALWTVTSPNCSGAGTLAVDDDVAHSGARSLRIDGGGGYCDHVFIAHTAAIESSARRSTAACGCASTPARPGPHHLHDLRDSADAGGKDLRMGGQSRSSCGTASPTTPPCPSSAPPASP
jgi:hypothetical protein